ncbi:thioesterase [Panacibacter ginsenosidivorans]|uniref:Thioesterase n=1 Tax=Panacibacter ginsenosidivorans TaxID=1813871 RepID=A0A5B8VEM9_9BACT|nr:acyl-CoA thioesterase [Panacibacter ginsenosidivorans]QEC69954.1 thioesterase [Panacibacter ginsenosidivorans]
MISFIKQVEVRWSDMDPNFHLRHSVYYDWGAYLRLSFLSEHALTPAVMQQLHFGPILFREECVFKREIVFGDIVTVDVAVSKSRRDMSRWSMVHQVWKNKDTLSAVITVDGAWLDTRIRKLAVPPPNIQSVFEIIPKTENFEWTD